MKRKNVAAIVVVSAFLLFTLIQSCQNPVESIEQSTSGTLSILFTSESARTIHPSVDMIMASFDITGEGPGDADFSAMGVSGTGYTVEDLVIGSWTISVNGLNSSGEIIMIGSVSHEIVSGENNIVVDLFPLSGNGSINLNISWTPGVLPAGITHINSSFTPAGGDPAALVFSVDDGSALYNQPVPAGYYIWDLSIMESGQLVYRMAPEVIRVVASQTTFYNLDLSSSIMISPAIGDSIRDTTPLLDWFDYPDAVSYDVQISEDSLFTSETPISVCSSEYQVETPISLNTHYWRIRPVYEGSITGDWGTTWDFILEYPIPTDGLLAEYLFQGGSADDSSVNGNNGTVYGAVSCADRFGNPDGALQLDGVDDRIEVPILYSGDQDPIALAGWVNLASDSGTVLYAEFTATSYTRNFFSLTMSSQTMAFDQFQPSGAAAISDSSPGILSDTWLFLTITKESDVVKFYLNGSLFSEKSHTETYSGGTPTTAGIGDRYGSGGWEFSGSAYNVKGKIDDFRFYDRALTTAEINDIYLNNN